MKHRPENSRKRDLRNKRMNALKQWEAGGLDGLEVQKERRSREGKRVGGKKKSATESNMQLEFFGEGLVLEQHRRTCEVRIEDAEVISCRYHPNLNLKPIGMLTVGDRVELQKEPASGDLFISNVEERSTKLSRPGPPDREHREQILAANIDQVVVVVSIKQPEFNSGFVDRYLMVCESSQIPVCLIVNKMDLFDEDIPDHIQLFKKFLDRVIFTSVKSGRGIEEVRELLNNRRSVVTGQSGVGKSSLLQALLPEQTIRTGEVREGDGKGKHTTTKSTLFTFGEGWVIDTPGIRRLGFWNLEPVELAQVFPFFRDLPKCKFGDCLHLSEPGCAVKNSVENGELNPLKYQSYLRIFESMKGA